VLAGLKGRKTALTWAPKRKNVWFLAPKGDI